MSGESLKKIAGIEKARSAATSARRHGLGSLQKPGRGRGGPSHALDATWDAQDAPGNVLGLGFASVVQRDGERLPALLAICFKQHGIWLVGDFGDNQSTFS